jgi:hypothetical protein
VETISSFTTTVASVEGGADLDRAIDELVHVTHATAAEQYGVSQMDCEYRSFAAERGERGNLVEFIAETNMPEHDQGLVLTSFDSAERAIAVVHWFDAVDAAQTDRLN